MTAICRTCGSWVSWANRHWKDEHGDDMCYDEDLNLIGHHEPAKVYDVELEYIVDELEATVEEAVVTLRGDGDEPTYPPGVDPERMRELWRASLTEAVREALEKKRAL